MSCVENKTSFYTKYIRKQKLDTKEKWVKQPELAQALRKKATERIHDFAIKPTLHLGI